MISIFEIFKIGVGPSSSHTVGPMKAAYEFIKSIEDNGFKNSYDKIEVNLYGSLGFTGLGHMSDKAVVLGLSGFHPETIDMNNSSKTLKNCLDSNTLIILDKKINFNIKKNIIFNKKFSTVSSHSNTMKFSLFKNRKKILEEIYFSIGGGFIIGQSKTKKLKKDIIFPYPFDSASKLLEQCKKSKLNIWQLVLKNEALSMDRNMVHKKIEDIWNTMNDCIERGISTKGYLSGESLETSATYANACGALVVSRHGCTPAMPSWTELQSFLSRKEIIDRPDLDDEINELHRTTTGRTPFFL